MALTSHTDTPKAGMLPEQDSAGESKTKPRTANKDSNGGDNDDDDIDDIDSQAWGSFDDDSADPLEAGDLHGDSGQASDPNNLEEMARWSGEPSIKGNSDVLRMILLNFCTLGITYVHDIHTRVDNHVLMPFPR
jgi:hypothetical protein